LVPDPLYYTISPIKTEREEVIYIKKVEKDVLYPWTFCIYGRLVVGRFVEDDVLYPWTFCREGRYVEGRFVDGCFVKGRFVVVPENHLGFHFPLETAVCI
jgi:hypothetical protein